MEEARCCAILDEAIEELLTQVAKKEVKLQDQRIRRDQKKKVDVERLPDAPGESCPGCWEWVDRISRSAALCPAPPKSRCRRSGAPGGSALRDFAPRLVQVGGRGLCAGLGLRGEGRLRGSS